MKPLLRRLLLLYCSLLAIPALPQAPARVTFTASNVQDSSGNTPLATGSLCVMTTDAQNRPMGYRIGSGSGQTAASTTAQSCFPVTGGAIQPQQIINSAASSPLNAYLRITEQDSSGATIRTETLVQTGTANALATWCSTVSGAVTCNWDQYPNSGTPQALVQVGPQGPPGPAGPPGSGTVDYTQVMPALNSQTFPGRFSGVGELLDVASAPILTVGNPSDWDSGSIRDPSNAWVARGKLWLLYTGAKSNVPPYTRVSLGLAYTTDLTGRTGWTKGGNVVVPVSTAGQWNSGAIFSPWVYHDSTTDDTYVYFSATASPEQWYSGPSRLGIAHVAPGADYTLAANWVMQASPALAAGQTFEEAQGLYAPSLVRIGSTYNLYYSSSASGTDFFVGLAQSSSPAGPFTKLPDNTAWSPAQQNFVAGTNPVFGDGYSEEPSCAQLDNGGVQCFTDDPLGTLTPAGFKSFATGDPAGISGWAEASPVIVTNPQSFYSGHLGAMGQLELSNGRWLLISNGSSDPSSQAVRSINAFQYTLAAPMATSPVPRQGGNTGATWGSTFTVPCGLGVDCSLSFGSDAAHSGQFFWDHLNNVIHASSTNNARRWVFEAPEVHISTGSDAAGVLALGDRLTPGNVGLWRGGSSSNYLNADGYDGITDWVGPFAMGAVGKTVMRNCALAVGCQFPLGLNIGGSGATGTGGTWFTSVQLRAWYSTPPSVPAQSCIDVVTSVPGIVAADHVSEVAPPAVLGNLSLNAYMTGAGGQEVNHFCNPTAAAVTPPAGSYSAVFYTHKQ